MEKEKIQIPVQCRFALAKVFRARFLEELNKAKLPIPNSLPSKWVVHCAHVGKGLPALKYLSRYLYRGVLSENNIVSNQKGNVTFKYVEGRTSAKLAIAGSKAKISYGLSCNTFCPKVFAGSGTTVFCTETPKNYWPLFNSSCGC